MLVFALAKTIGADKMTGRSHVKRFSKSMLLESFPVPDGLCCAFSVFCVFFLSTFLS